MSIIAGTQLIIAAFAVSILMAFCAFYEEVMETEYYESLEDEL